MMARYRKIDPRIWNDAKFRDLSNDGKLVFLFLLTHPHLTALGAMRATVPGLAAELGWLPEAFMEAFREAFAKGLLRHDEKACLVVLPNFIRYNAPESPNVVKSWDKALDLLPECDLKDELIQQVKGFAEALPEGFRKALPEAFAKSIANQEQEQDLNPPPLAPPPSGVGERGSRLPADWKLPDDWRTWAVGEGISDSAVDRIADQFADYWRAQPGQKGRKADWFATWRNWVRRDRTEQPAHRKRELVV